MDMKKLLLLSLILVGCAKQSPEPEQPQTITPTPIVSKFVEIYVIHGSVNNFASVKWSYDPLIDSGYANTNTLNRYIKNYTNSDSISIFTNSGAMINDNVTIYVNGIIKQQYTASQTVKVIKLN